MDFSTFKRISFCCLFFVLTIVQNHAATITGVAPDSDETSSDDNSKQSFVVENKDTFHLYLLIGQSNMAGRARIPENAKGDIPQTYLLNNAGEWSPAANPLNKYSTIRKKIEMQQLGPGYSFAQMMQTNSEKSIGLIVNARGGTKIDAWQKGGDYFSDAVARVKIAQKSGVLKGVIWHQGEGNKNDAKYLSKLVQLITDLREELGEPQLPFVAGQTANHERYRVVNAQIAKLPNHLEHTNFVSTENLTTQDGTHFDADSQIKLGRLYATAILKLSGNQ